MHRTLGAGVAAVFVAACGPTPNELTLLFVGRAPTAHVANVTWAPDPDRSRLVAFDDHLRIVHTIAGHRHDLPARAPGVDNAQFVSRRDAGIDGNLFDLRCQLRIVGAIEISADHHAVSLADHF